MEGENIITFGISLELLSGVRLRYTLLSGLLSTLLSTRVGRRKGGSEAHTFTRGPQDQSVRGSPGIDVSRSVPRLHSTLSFYRERIHSTCCQTISRSVFSRPQVTFYQKNS